MRIKLILCSIVWALCFLPLRAHDFVDGDLAFTVLDSTLRTCSVEKSNNSISGDVVIPRRVNYMNEEYEVVSIASYGFWRIEGITSVSIPEGLTSIGKYAFEGCESLKTITLPESITYIDGEAFGFCKSLTSITIPENVNVIPESCFESCTSLTSVSIPEGLTSIGEHAFSRCESLKTITLPESITYLGKSAFYGCESLTSITIPGNVNVIPHSCFQSCTSLHSVILLEGIESIGTSAFEDCHSLQSIEIPESVKSIEDQAFEDCISLSELTLPASLQKIHCEAFSEYSYSYNIKKLTCLATRPPILSGEYSSFHWAPSMCENATLYVPEDSYDLYICSPGWNRFYKIEAIKSEPDDPTGDEVELSVADPDHGVIKYFYPSGFDVKFSITPDAGWKVETVTFNDTLIFEDENGRYSTGAIIGDSVVEIVYSQIATDVEKLQEDSPDNLRVYCKGREVTIDNRPENELTIVYDDSGNVIDSGFINNVHIDESISVVLVKIGNKVYKMAVR